MASVQKRSLRSPVKSVTKAKKRRSDTVVEILEIKADESIINLSLNDCSCPICFEILIEPVNTPCNHELCLSCLAQMCDARNYACPICRNDMTTALESARKTSSLNKFVNKKRWAKIQVAFPQEIKNRRENRTAQLLAESIHNYKRTGIADSVYRSAFSSETAAVLSVISEANEWSEILRAEEARRQAEIEREEELSRIEIERIMNEERTLDSRAISEIEIRTRKQIEEQLSMAEIARIMREEQEVFQVQHNQPQPQLTQIVVNVNTNRA